MSENSASSGEDYGHRILPKDSADCAQWIRQHAEIHGFRLDRAQEAVLTHFERLYEDLLGLQELDSWLVRLLARKRVVRGIYLWGAVGRGKSFLMDSFFNCAPLEAKRRVHYHRFMQDVHHRLRDLQGREDPLLQVARDLARQARLLCLDEFQVTDITDAMLMRRLLEGLFAEGVVLVTTSNVRPGELYRNGLQRQQFLPAIDLIKANLDEVNLDAGIDYRLRALEQAGVYHTLSEDADARLMDTFRSVARHEGESDVALEVEGRPIRARRHAKGVAWFDFHELCETARSHIDYIELARRFHTVILAGLPRLDGRKLPAVRRLVWLIDEFYDRRVKLIVTAEAHPQQLFDTAENAEQLDPGLRQTLQRELERTVSRLIEMQTHDYLSQPHLP